MFSHLFNTYESVTPPALSRQTYEQDIYNEDNNIMSMLDIAPILSLQQVQEPPKQQPLKIEIQQLPQESQINISNNPFITNQDIKKPEITHSSNGKFNNRNEFIKALNDGYRRALSKMGLDPNYSYILTAQAALESNWGKNVAGNFNFGGVKATGSQKGSYKTTKEYSSSKGYYTIKDRFRDFKSIDDYCEARIELLSNKRYNIFNQFSFNNPQGIITHMLKKGYATAPINTYVSSVMKNYNTVLNALKS